MSFAGMDEGQNHGKHPRVQKQKGKEAWNGQGSRPQGGDAHAMFTLPPCNSLAQGSTTPRELKQRPAQRRSLTPGLEQNAKMGTPGKTSGRNQGGCPKRRFIH